MTPPPKTSLAARALQAALRLLRAFALGLLALLIVFEEWGWEPLQRAFGRLTRWLPLRALEARISALPPAAALPVFLLPTLLLLPAKLGAVWLLARGHTLLGVAAVALAKLVGTALVARLFALTRPALLRLAWFARAYTRWVHWKDALLGRLRASALWQQGRRVKAALRAQWASWRARLFEP